jgi:hypothetical protein
MQIERRLIRFKALPPTLFIQIDGGKENANKYVLSICEMMIAAGLFKKIELTRLPVGHTHEDIDGKFGRIWRFMRNRSAYTPQQYAELLQKCFETKSGYIDGKIGFEIFDIFMLPNYREFLLPFIDSKFRRYIDLLFFVV